MKNISVLIKPASGACNMTCDYCFYCDEAAKREQKFYGMMSEETLKNMIRRTMLHSEGSVSYTWQGGEPTLRGLDFFRKALYLQVMERRRSIYKIQNGIMSLSSGINELRITRISYRQRWIVLSCVYTVKRTAHVLLSGLWEMNVLTDVSLKKR